MRKRVPVGNNSVMNQLKMSQQQSIITLWQHGWSFRRIARELQLRRETVSKYVRQYEAEVSKPAKVPAGSPEVAEPKPAISLTGSEPVLDVKPAIPLAGSLVAGRQSLCLPLAAVIESAVQAGLSAQRIYQDLVGGHQFVGSYYSVQRFVRQLRQTQPVPFVRMEVEPGAEAQVDFGQGAWVLVEGKRKRPHLFRIVLSHSRKAYSEVVWRQTTESFIRCLENAFRYFGGVPKTLVIDNLRAAVTRTDWFDPELNAKVAEFCQHYGTAMLPTRPAMPRHKGKIEAGVKFAQNNALKGRSFASLAEQNLFLAEWESGVADTRIHGTTRQQVGKVFNEVERPNSRRCRRVCSRCSRKPRARCIGTAISSCSGLITPCRRSMWAARSGRAGSPGWCASSISGGKSSPFMCWSSQGRFATDRNHLHSPYRRVVEHGQAYLLDRARLIGAHTGSWAEAMVQQRGPIGVRVLHGLLALAQKHPAKALENAAQKALHHGVWRLRDLRTLLEQAGPAPQLDFLETHPLIRSLDTYRDYVPDCFAPSTLNQEPVASP